MDPAKGGAGECRTNQVVERKIVRTKVVSSSREGTETGYFRHPAGDPGWTPHPFGGRATSSPPFPEPPVPSVAHRLNELGIALPAAPKPVAAYVPAVRSGNLVFVSGQLPFANGALLATGPVPSKVGLEPAQAAARQCVLNGLAILSDVLGGDLDRVERIVRIGVFVQSDAGYGDQPKVANGASELLQEIFGERGRHARAAVGTNALPLDASVEIEFMFEIRG